MTPSITPPEQAQTRLLALDLCNRGVGFVVLESSEKLVDWGVKQTRQGKADSTVSEVTGLIQLYRPEVLIVEDCGIAGCRRGPVVRDLINKILELAGMANIESQAVSWPEVRKLFEDSGAFSKYQIACAVALRLSVLVRWLPPVRKTWMTEDPRMSIFDAAAFALTYFDRLQRRRTPRQKSNSFKSQTYAQNHSPNPGD